MDDTGRVYVSEVDFLSDHRSWFWEKATGLIPYVPTVNETTVVAVSRNGRVYSRYVEESRVSPVGIIDDHGSLSSVTTSGLVYGINNNSQLVGTFGGASGKDAFLWTPDHGEDLVDMLPGMERAWGFGLNDNGAAVGWQDDGSPLGDSNAYYWTKLGGSTPLGNLGGRFPSSEAYDVNNTDWVVGRTSIDGVGYHAFLWNLTEGMADLNNLVIDLRGLELHTADRINDKGQIVGWGFADGETHRYLLTPVPEPATLLLCASGAMAIFIARRRRTQAPTTRIEQLQRCMNGTSIERRAPNP